VAGVSAKNRDVLLRPFERGDLVEEAQVADSVLEVEKAFRTRPVIDVHANDAVASELAVVIEG
jgi:hypothetical protein